MYDKNTHINTHRNKCKKHAYKCMTKTSIQMYDKNAYKCIIKTRIQMYDKNRHDKYMITTRIQMYDK